MTPVLQCLGVGRVYGEARDLAVLHDVNLAIAEGEALAITGPSGSGKSTLLHILGCLDRPTAGEYRVGGQSVASLGDRDLSRLRNRNIGFVFQSFHLIPQLTVLENVEVPLFYRGVAASERHRRAAAMLERVGLGHRLHHRPTQLSGGESQRTAIARALLGEPRLILADEPTGNLDSKTGASILEVFDGLHEEGRTVVLVTHDPKVAARFPRRIHLTDGRIVSDETAPPRGERPPSRGEGVG